MIELEVGHGKGIPSTDRNHSDVQRYLLQIGLSALADTPDIVDNFSETLAKFLSAGNYPSGIKRILHFGRDFNNVSLPLDHLLFYGYFPLEIDVFVPLGDVENPEGSPRDARLSRATFLGITEARKDAKSSEVTFGGLAVPAGREIVTDNVVKIQINPRTGIAEVHPKFAQATFRATSPSMSTPGLR